MATVDDLISRYMEFVDRGIAMIPYKRVSVWKEFLFNPTATISKNIDPIGTRLIDLYVTSGIEMLIALIAMIPTLIILLISVSGILAVGIFGLIFAAAFVLGPILSFLYSLLELVVAKLLGGTGDMKANFNASVLPSLAIFVIMLPLTVAQIPFSWLSQIPLIGICGSILTLPFQAAGLIAGLYSLYLKYLAFKEVHKVSDLRAIAIVLLPVVAIMVLVVVLVVLLYAFLIAAVMGTAMTGSLLRPN